MSFTLYKDNSGFIQVRGLYDQAQPPDPRSYVNDLSASATLLDPQGAPVTGAENMTGEYQSGSNGTYRFALDPVSFDPPAGSGYTLVIDGTTPGGARYHDELRVRVKIRNKGTEL